MFLSSVSYLGAQWQSSSVLGALGTLAEGLNNEQRGPECVLCPGPSHPCNPRHTQPFSSSALDFLGLLLSSWPSGRQKPSLKCIPVWERRILWGCGGKPAQECYPLPTSPFEGASPKCQGGWQSWRIGGRGDVFCQKNKGEEKIWEWVRDGKE